MMIKGCILFVTGLLPDNGTDLGTRAREERRRIGVGGSIDGDGWARVLPGPGHGLHGPPGLSKISEIGEMRVETGTAGNGWTLASQAVWALRLTPVLSSHSWPPGASSARARALVVWLPGVTCGPIFELDTSQNNFEARS